MRISHFFIDRPIFAGVVSVVIVILGLVSFGRLPVAQYPEIAPPVINVTGQYPGASAEVVAATVVSPLEQQINGVENMLYVSSNSTGDGRFTISVTFDLGTNLDIAQVQVQNRVAIAQPRLPADVRNIGVTVAKASPDLMLVVHLYSPDKSRDTLFISNYVNVQITDVLSRIDGVGSITVFGSRDYSMRVWLDPDRLQSMGLTAGDVVTAQWPRACSTSPLSISPARSRLPCKRSGGSPTPTSSATLSSSRPRRPWYASRMWPRSI
jgi:multidrug efflux pump subunit AcrB